MLRDLDASACRSPSSPVSDRTPAMIVLDALPDSCRTNSRPRPRLAPVMTYVEPVDMVVESGGRGRFGES